jgi:hypothetical protein
VPLEEPPVGTRGRPFGDLFLSGFVGSSQLPDFIGLLEKSLRCIVENAFNEDAPSEETAVVLTVRKVWAFTSTTSLLHCVTKLDETVLSFIVLCVVGLVLRSEVGFRILQHSYLGSKFKVCKLELNLELPRWVRVVLKVN